MACYLLISDLSPLLSQYPQWAAFLSGTVAKMPKCLSSCTAMQAYWLVEEPGFTLPLQLKKSLMVPTTFRTSYLENSLAPFPAGPFCPHSPTPWASATPATHRPPKYQQPATSTLWPPSYWGLCVSPSHHIFCLPNFPLILQGPVQTLSLPESLPQSFSLCSPPPSKVCLSSVLPKILKLLPLISLFFIEIIVGTIESVQMPQYTAEYCPQGAMQTALRSIHEAPSNSQKPPPCLLCSHFSKLSEGICQSQTEHFQSGCTPRPTHPVLTVLTVLSV